MRTRVPSHNLHSTSSGRARRVLYVLALILALVYGQYNELSMALDVPLIRVAGNSFYLLDILLFVCFGVWLFTKRELAWGQRPQLWLLLFLAWTVIVGTGRSVLLDVPYHTWIREMRTVAYFGFVLLLPEAVNSKERAITIARLLLIGSVAIAAMAVAVRLNYLDITPGKNLLVFTATGDARIFIVYGVERATYAALFAAGALLALGNVFLVLVLALNVLTLVLSLTRGAYIALFAGIVMTIAATRSPWRLLRSIALVLALVGFAYAGGWFLDTITGEGQFDAFVARLGELSDLTAGSGTVGTRLVESRVVLQYLFDNPDALVLGQGLGGLFEDPLNLLTNEIQYLGDRRYSYVHNGYLWTVLRSGVIGAFLFYAFWIGLAYKSLVLLQRTTDPRVKGILLGIIGVVVGALTLSLSGQPLGEGPRMSVLAVYAAVGLATTRLVEQGNEGEAAPRNTGKQPWVSRGSWPAKTGADSPANRLRK